MTDPETVAVYDRKADEYVDVVNQGSNDPTLMTFLDALSPGARVLDLGAGPGHMAAVMAEKGIDVEAWDPSAEMLRHCRAQGLTAHQKGFDDLPGAPPFDGIWANFSLLHAREGDLPRHLADIHAALAPAGVFHIAMKVGDQNGRDAIGRYYTYVTEEELEDLLTQAGFTPGTRHAGQDRGLSGSIDPWISILAHA